MAFKKTVAYIDEDRNTNLHYLAAAGRLEKIKEELEDNEIDPENYLGWTPLMMATRYGHFDVIKYLLEMHADATRINCFGCNILLMAVASGNVAVISLILEHLLLGGISKQSIQKMFSPISLAILFDNIEVVKYLIEKGFCVNITSPVTELTPIVFANTIRNAQMIELLRSKGAKEQNKYEVSSVPLPFHCLNAPQPLVFVDPTRSPLFCISPVPKHLSPISPLVCHQFMFPPNFPYNHQYANPFNGQLANIDIENSRMNQSACYLSPSYNVPR